MLDDLKDDQWERIKDILPGKSAGRGRASCDNRGFLNGLKLVYGR